MTTTFGKHTERDKLLTNNLSIINMFKQTENMINCMTVKQLHIFGEIFKEPLQKK